MWSITGLELGVDCDWRCLLCLSDAPGELRGLDGRRRSPPTSKSRRNGRPTPYHRPCLTVLFQTQDRSFPGQPLYRMDSSMPRRTETTPFVRIGAHQWVHQLDKVAAPAGSGAASLFSRRNSRRLIGRFNVNLFVRARTRPKTFFVRPGDVGTGGIRTVETCRETPPP